MTRLILAIFSALSAFAADATLKPPVAKQVPKEMKNFGDTRNDPYFWMRYRESDPEVMKYIEAENAYSDAAFAPLKPLAEKVYKEFLSRIQQTDTSAPYRHGKYFYYTRTEEGKQYPIYCRKPGSLDGPEQVLFDVNEMAKGHKFYSLGGMQPDPKHQLLAFATDVTGYREYTLQFKNATTGAILPDRIERTAGSAWSADSKYVFYGRQQEKTKRSFQIWLHELGTPAASDKLVFEEKDEKFNVGIGKSLSGDYLFVVSASGRTSETRYLDARRPLEEPKVLLPRKEGISYEVAHHGGLFYIRINDSSRDFRVVTAPVAAAGDVSKWKEVVAPAKGLYVEDHLLLKNHAVYLVRVQGVPQLRVVSLADGKSHDVQFAEPSYALNLAQNREFDTQELRFMYSSMVTPMSTYDYDLNARTRKLVKQQKVPGGYDPAQYTVERITATSHDGVKVPVTIAYKKGLVKNGQAPCLLYGYGAYAIPMTPFFSPQRLSYLDRGFVYALAHLRGGTDLGYSWYEDGKLLKKKNTFRDFVAVAESLVAQKYTNSSKLAIEGGSAGGVLVGAAVTMKPQLFHTVVAAVPFVDVVNSLLDTSIPLSTTDQDEFGNPAEQTYYEYMKSYSPYDNTRAAKYPHMYIFSGVNDSQVPYWEPLKWTAQLRRVNQSANRILLRMNTAAGHGGASGRYDRLRETAESYAFVLSTMGITQ